MDELKHVIVIGASAGGLKAVSQLLSTITFMDEAAVFIVLHISKDSNAEIILQTLQKNSRFKCVIPATGSEVKKGIVYLAPTNNHLLLQNSKIIVQPGAHENRWRPSIDVLFRSAAVAYSSSVIGIILTGLLDDGVSGMVAIKRCGGICIVQEPTEAEFDSMPLNTLNKVDVDYQVSINDIPFILEDLFSKKTKNSVQVPDDLLLETDLAINRESAISNLPKIGEHSNFTCPDCGGGLWKMKYDPVNRYRCHTGHAYTQKSLLEKQSDALEESLWISLRMLEEKRNLLLSISEQEVNKKINKNYFQEAEELKIHIERIKIMILTINNITNVENHNYAFNKKN